MDHKVQNWFERRRTPRFQAKTGVFVMIKSNNSKLPIIDISLGGLAFYSMKKSMAHHDDNSDSLKRNIQFQIIAEPDIFSLDNINGKIISTIRLELDSDDDRIEEVKRFSVQFENLSQNQIGVLNHLIENHTTGEII